MVTKIMKWDKGDDGTPTQGWRLLSLAQLRAAGLDGTTLQPWGSAIGSAPLALIRHERAAERANLGVSGRRTDAESTGVMRHSADGGGHPGCRVRCGKTIPTGR